PGVGVRTSESTVRRIATSTGPTDPGTGDPGTGDQAA
ncbi:MAG: hypothetical protein QOI20_516, partial [Acidimicrobiaceae bacterium]|nr:hypothetical protein [Acidimicrobiaceae bacterium]